LKIFSHFYAKQAKNGNANPKQRLINSQKFFKSHKSEQRRIITNKKVFGSKTKVPSQQVQKQVIE
jgi:hypothetical protein